jgi:hypothetical protein
LQAIRNGVPVPKRIAEFPELLPWLRFEFDAFFELVTCSNGGFIPWTAIQSYAQAYGIKTEEDLSRFTRLIRAMDKVYLEYTKKKNEFKSKVEKTKSKGVGRK